ncbi:hypothetical protein WJX79_000452 [Trebouxia sp. C0005]
MLPNQSCARLQLYLPGDWQSSVNHALPTKQARARLRVVHTLVLGVRPGARLHAYSDCADRTRVFLKGFPDDTPGVCSQVKEIMMSCISDSIYGCPGCMSPRASSEDETSATCVPKGLGPRIYVGGIPNALSQTMIKNHFSHYGKVVDVYFPKHPVTSQRQAFCFVTFSTRKAANAAVSQSNRKINGHQATLAPTLPTAQDMSGALDMHSLLEEEQQVLVKRSTGRIIVLMPQLAVQIRWL